MPHYLGATLQLLKLTILCLMCFAAISCGLPVGSPTTQSVELPISDEEIISIKSYQSFSCETLNDPHCPAGLGRILVLDAKNRNKSKLCSGFLISKNVMVTNNHCLASEDECSRAVVSVYDGHSANIRNCKKVMMTKVDSKILQRRAIDLTVFEMDRNVNSESFKLARNLPPEGENLTLWAVDQLDVNQARITELNCLYVKKNYSMELNDCPAIGGNSGSPIVNSMNQVVGILWGGSVRNRLDVNTPLNDRRTSFEVTLATDIQYLINYLK